MCIIYQKRKTAHRWVLLRLKKRLNHYLYQSIQDVFKSKTYRTGIRRGQRWAKKQLELDSCSETTNEKKSVSWFTVSNRWLEKTVSRLIGSNQRIKIAVSWLTDSNQWIGKTVSWFFGSKQPPRVVDSWFIFRNRNKLNHLFRTSYFIANLWVQAAKSEPTLRSSSRVESAWSGIISRFGLVARNFVVWRLICSS